MTHSLPIELALSLCAAKRKLDPPRLEQAIEVAYLIHQHIPETYLSDCAFRYNKNKTISFNLTNYWVWQVPSSPKFSECLLIWAHDAPRPSTNEQCAISSYAYAACGMIWMTFAEILDFTLTDWERFVFALHVANEFPSRRWTSNLLFGE
jgi:hypothetical protein